MARGRVSLTWETSFTPITTQHDAVEDVAGQGLTPVVHDQSILFSESRLGAEWAFADGWALGLVVPFKVVGTGIEYVDAEGRSRELARPDTHHRDETLAGPGDPWLTVRAQRAAGAWRLGARAGVSLPLGRTEEDPFRLGDMGLRHQHFQMGTGTVNPIVQVEAGRPVGPLFVGGWALTQQVLYENGKGYQAGDRYAGGVTGRWSGGRWTVGGGPELQGETAERWQGVVEEEDGNRGRVDVLLGAEASFAATRALALTAALKVPVYTYVVGGQVRYPLVASLGVAVSFGAAVAPHAEGEEGEEGEAHHDPHGGPVDPGPVAGKITVIDYWAEWCEPCKELDALLAPLVERGAIEVRRVDVTTAHIHFELPRLKLYGADGKEQFDRSGTPAELAAAVEQAIR